MANRHVDNLLASTNGGIPSEKENLIDVGQSIEGMRRDAIHINHALVQNMITTRQKVIEATTSTTFHSDKQSKSRKVITSFPAEENDTTSSTNRLTIPTYANIAEISKFRRELLAMSFPSSIKPSGNEVFPSPPIPIESMYEILSPFYFIILYCGTLHNVFVAKR